MNLKAQNKLEHRVSFIGDSFAHGTGDPNGLDWVGRVVTDGKRSGWEITAYNLGVRRGTSREVVARLEHESLQRFEKDAGHYLVFSFGVNDVMLENGFIRIPTAESHVNFQRIIEKTPISMRHFRHRTATNPRFFSQ